MSSTRMIFPLFSTPVYVNNVGDFPRPSLEALQFTSTMPGGGTFGFLSSVDKNVLDRPEFSGVREIVMREIRAYAHDVLAVDRALEFYVTNSWINVHKRGHQAGAHMHHNSLISGVLYLRTNERSGNLVFHREVLSLVPFPPALDLDMTAFNIYNCKSWGYQPKTNDVCLFPSVVSHSVDPNESDEDRWCLAFNVFVRGNIGSLHKLTLK
ncbi:MAG TPA: TIGR02466 family protein [Gammaproteobacteria bacterium]|nr:TIGR02466 family protein [Gammaproteobacteria bacterium]